MTGPVVRLCLSLRSQLKAAREANQRLLMHVARQEAVITEAIARRDEALADIAGYERMTRALMETAPSDVGELTDG